MTENTEFNKSHEVDGDDEKIEEWSDGMCIKISMEDNFPASVKNSTIQKGIINRFLNFYLSGKVQKGLSARDLIFAVIAIMPYSIDSEELIWRDDQYSDDGNLFYLTPEDRLQIEIRRVMAKHNVNLFQNESEQQDENNELNDIPEAADSELTTDEVKSETNRYTDTPGETEQENDATDKTSNESDATAENTSTDNETPPSRDLVWYRRKRFERASKQLVEFSPVDNSAFCISCNKLLDKWDEDTAARIQLKYFFGVVALSLMRTVAKSHQHVMTMFTSTFPKIIAGTNRRIHYSPPSNTCVRKTYKTLRKTERKTNIMFAKLVVNSFYINRKYNDLSSMGVNTGGIKNIFNATVLAHTAHYGMDIISMLQQIAPITISFSTLFESLNTEETAASWNKVNDFFKKYMRKSGYQATCHWARIIDREQFKYLSCENSYELAVVIAVFMEKLSTNDVWTVWSARWVNTGKNLEIYKKLGLEMYDLYKEREMDNIFNSFSE